MANASNEFEQLTFRLSRLERQNQWLKLGLLSIVAIAGFAAIVGAAASKEPRIIEAEGFIMRDANGVARVEMSKDGFFINNEAGKHRISIFSGKEGGTGISLFADDTYKKQVMLGIQDKLSFCGFTVNDENGTNRIFMNTVKGKPRLELQDETGKAFFTQSQP